MSTDLGTVYVTLRGDNKHLAATLKKSKSQIKDFAKSANRLYTGLGASVTNIINRSFNQVFHTLKRVAEYTAIAAAAIGIAIGKLAIDAVESENLFSVSMGAMEESTRRWSKGVAEAFKLNEFTVRKNVGVFNVMLNSMGVTEKNAQTMAEQMTDLAFNMSSFYNLSHEESFNKIQSGLVGLTKPLQRIGILTKISILENYIEKNDEFARSIGYSGGELTELQKVYTRFVVIQEQTSKAADDLYRTMDVGANIFRAIWDKTKELGIALGNVLLPQIEGVGLAIREFLIDNQSKIVYMFETFVDAIAKVIPFLQEFGATVLVSIIYNLGSLVDAFKSLMDPTDEVRDAFYNVSDAAFNVMGVFIHFWGVILDGVMFMGTLVTKLQDLFEWLGFTKFAANGLSDAVVGTTLLMLYFSRSIISAIKLLWLFGIALWKRLAPAVAAYVFEVGVVIATNGFLAASMGIATASATFMWNAIGGPIGLVIVGIIAASAAVIALTHAFNKGKKEAEDFKNEMELEEIEKKIKNFKIGGGEEGQKRLAKIEKERDLLGEKMARREVERGRAKKLMEDSEAGRSDKLLKDRLAKEKAANKERLREYKKSLSDLRDAQKEIVTMSIGDTSFQTSRRNIKAAAGTLGQVAQQEAALVAAMERVEVAIKNEGQKTRQDGNTTR